MATCKDCLHYDACSKWTDFPKQCGIPVCARFNAAPKTEVATEIADLIKGVVEFDISLSESETEYLLIRIDEALNEFLEGIT